MVDNQAPPPSGRLVAIEETDALLQILRAIAKGREPHQIQLAGFPDMRVTVDKLIELGLVDTLGAAPLLQADYRPGTYFLTEKGERWRRTYGRRERRLHWLSRWQYFGGVFVGLVVSWVASLTLPYVRALLGLASSLLKNLTATV